MIILVVLMGLWGYSLGTIFSPGLVEGNRLIPLASSNLYSLLNDMLEGSSTIKVFHQNSNFLGISNPKLDSLYGSLYARGLLESWLNLRLAALSSLGTFALGVMSCLAPKTTESAATFGLSLLYTSSLADLIVCYILQLSYFESRVSCVSSRSPLTTCLVKLYRTTPSLWK